MRSENEADDQRLRLRLSTRAPREPLPYAYPNAQVGSSAPASSSKLGDGGGCALNRVSCDKNVPMRVLVSTREAGTEPMCAMLCRKGWNQ